MGINDFLSRASYKHFLVDAGDILLATSGVTIEKLHDKVAYARAELLPLCMNTSTVRFKVHEEQLVDDYLYFFLQTDLFKTQIGRQATGSAQLNFGPSHLKKVVLPVPPSECEQRAITGALGDVDALLAELTQLIAKKRNLKQAAMQQLLTGETRLPGSSGEWKMKRLGDVLIRVVNGAVYEPTNSFGLPITRIETISDGVIDYDRVGYAKPTTELAKYKLERGDILFSHINSVDHIGKVAIFRAEADLYHGMNLLLLRAGDVVDSQFLFYWLGSCQGRKKSVSLAKQAISQASINTSEVKNIEASLPPLPEQAAIAAVLSDMDAELGALEQRLAKTRALKQGMMQELLTGRTRLV